MLLYYYFYYMDILNVENIVEYGVVVIYYKKGMVFKFFLNFFI